MFLTIHYDSQPTQACGNLALELSLGRVGFPKELALSSCFSLFVPAARKLIVEGLCSPILGSK